MATEKRDLGEYPGLLESHIAAAIRAAVEEAAAAERDVCRLECVFREIGAKGYTEAELALIRQVCIRIERNIAERGDKDHRTLSYNHMLRQDVDLAVAAEREECAKVAESGELQITGPCDPKAKQQAESLVADTARSIAAAIRARSTGPVTS